MSRRSAWCALLALALVGCAPSRPGLHRYINGRPPSYEAAARVEPAESLPEFTARVRRLQAQAVAARRPSIVPTLETTDAALSNALARLALDPSSGNHYVVAAEYRRRGVSDFAHEHLTQALGLDPTNGAAYDARARIVRDWGFPGLALPDAHRAVFFAPRSPAVHNTMGTIFYRLGRYEDARRSFDAALSLDPLASYALVNRCSVDLADAMLHGAVAACTRALDIDPGSVLARANLAKAAALIGAATVTSDARD